MTTLGGFQKGQLRSSDNLPNLTYQKVWVGNIDNQAVEVDGATSAAPIGATYIVQIPNDSLNNEQALSNLTTGILLNTVTDTPSAELSTAVPGTDYLFPNTGNLVTQNAVLNNVTINGTTTTQGITFTSLTQEGTTIVPLYTNNIGSITVSDLLAEGIQSGSVTAASVTAGALFTAAVEATINFLIVRSLNNTSPIGATPVATLSGGVNIIGASSLTGGDFNVDSASSIWIGSQAGTKYTQIQANKLTFAESGTGGLQLYNNHVLMSCHNILGSQFTIDCETIKLMGADGGGNAGITLTSNTPSANNNGTINVYCNTLAINADGLTDSTANFAYDQITIRSDVRGTSNNFVTLQGKNINLSSASGTEGTAAITADTVTILGNNSTSITTTNGDIALQTTDTGDITIQSSTDMLIFAQGETGLLQIWGHDVNVLGNVVIGDAPAFGVDEGDSTPTPPSTTTLTINAETTFDQSVTFDNGLTLNSGLTITSGGLTVSAGGISNTGSLTTTSFTTSTATIPTYVSKAELPAETAPLITAGIAAGVPPLIEANNTTVVFPAIAASAAAVTATLTTAINTKQDSNAGLTDISNITITDNEFIIGSSDHWVGQNASGVASIIGLGTSSNATFNTVTATSSMASPLVGGTNYNTGIVITPQGDGVATFMQLKNGSIAINSNDTALNTLTFSCPIINFTSVFGPSFSSLTIAHPTTFATSVSMGTTLAVTGGISGATLTTSSGIHVNGNSTFAGISSARSSITFNAYTDVTFNGTVTFPGSGSYQPLNTGLTQISAITSPALNTIIYANSSNQWVGATGDTARGVLGLATTNAVTFLAATITNNIGSSTLSTSGLATVNSLSVTTNAAVTGTLNVTGDTSVTIINADQLSLAANGRINFLNSTTDPSAPVSGGILYVVAGALKYIGSNGTITTLAIA